MNDIRFIAMPAGQARAFQAGEPDAYGMAPERRISDGDGVPCRHCLDDVAKGEAYLILAYRPFPQLQPYAETGPIFLHSEACDRAADQHDTPAMLMKRATHLIKGYGRDDRIVYGTSRVVAAADLAPAVKEIFGREDVAYVHVRSALNNCYTCRVERA